MEEFLVPIMIILALLGDAEGQTCPALAINNGNISLSDGLNFKSRAKYSCDKGFSLVGNTKRYCNEYGNWSSPGPSCIDIVALKRIVIDIPILALKGMLNDIKDDVALLKQNVLETTAFSATMSASLWDITSGEMVPFDTARTNIGDDFDITTHKYTCPISGYYFFSASLTFTYSTNPRPIIHRSNGKKVEVTMKMDSVRISDIMYGGHSDDNDPYGIGSHSLVRFCKKGQEVFLQGDNDNEPYYLKGRSEGDHSHFMGFLLYTMDVLPL